MVNINEEIPDFEFEVFHNDEIKKIKFSDYRNKWLVLVFYPADFTFVCPTELEELADLYDEFKKEGAEIISISTDTAFVHKAWHDSSPSIEKIRFPMAADPSGKICKEFKTYIEEEGLSLRGSFVINPDGILKTMEIHDNSVGRSGRELLRKLQAAKFVTENEGLVCPANWLPGKETLKPGIELVGKI